MPDQSLEQTLLNRPVTVDTNVQYPTTGPSNLGTNIIDAITTASGLAPQKPGDLPTAIGAAASMLPVGDMVQTLRKIAPKRAAEELAKLLNGTSIRLPEGSGFNLSENDALKQALLQRVTGRQPPPPTELKISGTNPNFQSLSRILPRPEAVNDLYRSWQRSIGNSPYRTLTVNIGSTPNDFLDPVATARQAQLQQRRNLAQMGNGSVNSAIGGKSLTVKEMQALLLGPKEALAKGMLTPEQAQEILTNNQAKINTYLSSINEADAKLYQKQLDDAVKNRSAPTAIVSPTERSLRAAATLKKNREAKLNIKDDE